MRWSPVGACGDWEHALLTARAMVGAARPGGQVGEASHWTERAEALLAPLLHAAALTDAGMTQVVRWVNRHDLDTALAALSVAGADLAGDVLTGLAATEDRELSGIWSTTAGPWTGPSSPTSILTSCRVRATPSTSARPPAASN